MKNNILEYAERRLEEASRNDEMDDMRYWAAYKDGAKAALRETGTPEITVDRKKLVRSERRGDGKMEITLCALARELGFSEVAKAEDVTKRDVTLVFSEIGDLRRFINGVIEAMKKWEETKE